MTLLITVFAAVFATLKWYSDKDNELRLAPLLMMYWGASLMWLVDAVFEFVELKDEFFAPAVADMINDAFLGFAAVALGLVIWLVILLVKDPSGRVRKALTAVRK